MRKLKLIRTTWGGTLAGRIPLDELMKETPAWGTFVMSDRLLIEELADGAVRVSLQRSGQAVAEPGAAVAFAPPFTETEREDLRWYLEDYLRAPYAVYEERGQAIEGQLRGWGEALFAALFGTGKLGRDLYLQAREG